MFSLAEVAHEVFLRVDQIDPDIPKMKKSGIYDILKASFDVTKQALASGEEVSVPGFGKFKISTRKARMGRNPRTGESIEIAEKQAVKFSPSSVLKEAVAEGGKSKAASSKPETKSKKKKKKKK